MTGAELVPIEGELVHTSTLFGTDNPAEVVERAAVVATTLADLVRKQNLIVRIGQGEHVRVEGWTLLGSMLGVFPVVEWTRPVYLSDEARTKADRPIGWEARVEARTRSGEVVGAAEAECLRDEPQWSYDPPVNKKTGKKPPVRDDYALRSMAQTRAVSKALRLPLGFVMQLAGFDPTPAEEMPKDLAGPLPSSDPGGPARIIDADDWESVALTTAPPVMPTATGHKPATEAQKKKLDVLVKSTVTPPLKRVYATVARSRVMSTDSLILDVGGMGEDGELHWSPLRDALTRAEAHDLIDRLEKLEPQA